MSINLTANFLSNSRGITLLDGGGITWSINKNTNAITATSGGSGTVTSVGYSVNATYLALGGTASPITTTGAFTLDLSTGAKASLALANTSLQPVAGLSGSYTNVNLTLNTSGQITAIANGSGGVILTAQVPATIPGLVYWFDASILKGSFPTGSGNGIPLLGSPDPYRAPGSALVSGTSNGAFLDTSTLNSLPVLNFGGTSASQYTLNTQMVTPAQTIFVVFKPASLSAQGNFCGGATSSIALGVQTTGQLQLQITNTVGIASSTAVLAVGTWYQVNTSYDGTNYIYRIARAADVSGTSLHTATQPQTGFGWNGSTSNQPFNGLIAEFIYYNRVLTLAQKQAVEAYILSKWGV